MAGQNEIEFAAAALDRLPPDGLESVSAPAVFRDATMFAGKLYVGGPAGLFEYGAAGSLAARYLVGSDLPPAPLVQMAAGAGAGSAAPRLWIATDGEGLLSFDGRRFQHIRPREAPFRKLTALLPLETGRVLLATEKKGLLVYDGKRLARFHPALADLSVTALAGDEASLWLGTLESGLLHFHAGQLDRFGEAQGLPDARVTSLAVAGETAWAGTALGVAQFRAGRFERVVAEGLFANTLLARSGALAVGTLEDGVVEISTDAKPPRPRRPAREALDQPVERLIEIEGRLHALARDGLYEAGAGWRRVIESEGAQLADRNISALSVDSSNRLWVGFFDRGLEILDAGGRRLTRVENEHVFCVNRITHLGASGAAVATANGLVMFDASGAERQVLGRAEGLIASHATDVVAFGGGMAVATPAGITLIDQGGARSLYAFHGLVNNHVYALAASGDRLLAGTLGGLSVLEAGFVRASYTTANSALKHNWITAIVPVESDWFVGTYGAGVLRHTAGGEWQSFGELAPGTVINPNAMVTTGRAVYAGTLGGGLLVYNRAAGRWTTLTRGLPSLNVTALAARNGVLYIGTDNGLARAAEQNLAAP